ncbi:MGDG synthase family glycosyltransferase [Actinopolymorpha pittospori]|uniref:1,2-diacylglycerol 3-beta-galactosyltransferase n=1 Tax=Actinopolymorpha pittospori TaxID=648752 RepID=A0A927RAB3_9ACTN|nr:1,2-diacylglycerol 3-beta-galactosyltransferase [Actinopolymorpha pittospori]
MTRSGGVAADGGPAPLLFLLADTGGGHRSAARAVAQALDHAFPGRFAPVTCDPFTGPEASRLLRFVSGGYGPVVRRAPWIWGAAYYATSSRSALRFLRSTLLTAADRAVAEAVVRHRPEAILSFHPLAGWAAVRASRTVDTGAERGRPPVVTVVTDLITAHPAWRYAEADHVVVPTSAVLGRCQRDGTPARCVEVGVPVTAEHWDGPQHRVRRLALRRSLGVAADRFLIVLTGGAEGTGGIGRRAIALLERFDDVHVVAVCGRNHAVRERLARFDHAPGRLTVLGFVDNLADWLGCADVVVCKAGPSTVAEATCLGAPLVLTSHLPGQEKGTTEYVVRAGAGRHAAGVRDLIEVVDQLRRNPFAVEAMRAASARLGRPWAAAEIAALVGRLTRTGAGARRAG